MRNKLNEKLIASIRESLPEGENLAQNLMDVLCIGKEAIYRRIRGDVPFTFDEVSTLSSKIGFSIDEIVGLSNSGSGLYELDLVEPENLIDRYAEKLDRQVKILKKMRKASQSMINFAINSLPDVFALAHDNIARFRLYHWLYQNKTRVNSFAFKDLVLSPEVIALQKQYTTDIRSMSRACFIMDRNVFISFLHEIDYFYRLKLLTKEEVEILKKEMITMLNDLEDLAVAGVYPNTGSEVHMYISNVDLESSFSLYEYNNTGYAYLKVSTVEGVESRNPLVCKKQKQWIESIRKYSVLISQSGEVQRMEYFNTQRDFVDKLAL
ncbi:hypothetical protein [Parabacteroides sp. Marseille-P3160]|uniref:hypothetical protein n=1 Tax=Parabacteroides sp. Marseille-P3160 TaxID=1917887 RepID=UPI0009B9F997|nr:hypothetical protein [Parabacteroides sp. Marseille-P3160]